MHLAVRLLSRDESIALADALRQGLHDLADSLKDFCEKRAEKLLIQTARSRIDRQDAQSRFPAFFEQREILDLAHLLLAAPAESIVDLADSEEPHPCLELSLEELLIEERDLQKSRTVVNIDAQDMNAAPRAPLGYMTDDACDRLLLADRERGERRQHAPVFVCARIIGQEVIDGEEADIVQRLVFLRADALELQKTRLQLHGRPLSERCKTQKSPPPHQIAGELFLHGTLFRAFFLSRYCWKHFRPKAARKLLRVSGRQRRAPCPRHPSHTS